MGVQRTRTSPPAFRGNGVNRQRNQEERAAQSVTLITADLVDALNLTTYQWEATMRKFTVCSLAVAIVAIISATIIEAGHRSTTVAAAGGIDTAKLTLAAGPLPLAQVNEPF